MSTVHIVGAYQIIYDNCEIPNNGQKYLRATDALNCGIIRSLDENAVPVPWNDKAAASISRLESLYASARDAQREWTAVAKILRRDDVTSRIPRDILDEIRAVMKGENQ